MSDIVNAIMDSAERRMRLGGFNGFSFRDIATEVGIKSSSVHYHFPTKEKLAAAVTRRYTDRVLQYFNDRLEETADPVKVWTRGFRSTLHSPEHMCPCTVLGASTGDLPPEVATEVQRFYKLSLERLVAAGLSARKATELLATLTGALILANSLDDMTAYDQATRHLLIDSEESAVDLDAGLQLVEK